MVEIIKHYLISGRVQGVGFRAFTHRQAKSLNLKGWVRNLEDGRVEAMVLGSPEKLVELEILLQRGPELCHVETITVAEIPNSMDNEKWTSFEVRKDGLNSCA